MKSTANAARSPFLIMTLLLSMLFASLALAADEGAPIKDVIVKEGKDMNNIQVHAVKNQDGWALASFTYEDDKHVTRGASALLKKSGEAWQLVQFSGKTPTTDLLRQNDVPSSSWGGLIDADSVSKTRPALAFLHSRYPRQSFESVELSGKYALARWFGGEDSGMTLMRQSGNTWKVLLSTGGVIDRSAMRQSAVSDQHIRELMGIE